MEFFYYILENNTVNIGSITDVKGRRLLPSLPCWKRFTIKKATKLLQISEKVLPNAIICTKLNVKYVIVVYLQT